MKKTYKRITFDRFSECLALVGWCIKNGGNDYYYLVNSFGNETGMSFWCENKKKTIYQLSVKNFGGKTPKSYIAASGMCFLLNNCVLEIAYEEDEVKLLSLSCCHGDFVDEYNSHGSGAFINFYKKDD